MVVICQFFFGRDNKYLKFVNILACATESNVSLLSSEEQHKSKASFVNGSAVLKLESNIHFPNNVTQ